MQPGGAPKPQALVPVLEIRLIQKRTSVRLVFYLII
jgi:hypothetical protein